jgi:RNA polymerase sigma-70 factor (ECF subfamily)
MTKLNFEDRELVEKFLRSRDESSFRQLYRLHTPALYALALRFMSGSSADAEDVIQETWIRAAERFSGFRWESSLRTWLCGIVINCSRDLQSKLKRHEISPETITHQNFISSDLERLIHKLPAGYREVLVLHDIEGYTHQEISVHLGIQEGTSKSQLFQARKWLRERLQGENHE